MIHIVRSPPKINPPRDRADEIAATLLKMALRHFIARWNEQTEDFDILALHKKNRGHPAHRIRTGREGRMNPRRHPLLHDAIELLKACGATNIEHSQRRHIQLSATYRGHLVITTISVSPSCPFAGVKTIAALKRKLRAVADSTQLKTEN
jgi:hypothetical protein